MGNAPQPASVKRTQAAVNQSRNERQKSVLLIEIAQQVRTTTARLIDQTKQLLAHTQKLHQEIKEDDRRR